MDAGHAPAGVALTGIAELAAELRWIGRHRSGFEILGSLMGVAVEPTACITAPPATQRVRRVVGDSEALQGGTVDDRRVAPEAAQQHRPVRRNRVERAAPVAWISGDALADPDTDPVPGRLRLCCDRSKNLLTRGPRERQTWNLQRRRRKVPAQVNMGLDEPGGHQTPAGIDHPCFRSRERPDVGAGCPRR